MWPKSVPGAHFVVGVLLYSDAHGAWLKLDLCYAFIDRCELSTSLSNPATSVSKMTTQIAADILGFAPYLDLQNPTLHCCSMTRAGN